jgi:hypothetical protein
MRAVRRSPCVCGVSAWWGGGARLRGLLRPKGELFGQGKPGTAPGGREDRVPLVRRACAGPLVKAARRRRRVSLRQPRQDVGSSIAPVRAGTSVGRRTGRAVVCGGSGHGPGSRGRRALGNATTPTAPPRWRWSVLTAAPAVPRRRRASCRARREPHAATSFATPPRCQMQACHTCFVLIGRIPRRHTLSSVLAHIPPAAKRGFPGDGCAGTGKSGWTGEGRASDLDLRVAGRCSWARRAFPDRSRGLTGGRRSPLLPAV